jgi:hypothetical protein
LVVTIVIFGSEVVAVLERAAVVNPVGPFGAGDLEVVDDLPWPPAA